MARTHQIASGNEAAQIAQCNLMGIELTEYQTGSLLIRDDERMRKALVMFRPPKGTPHGWGLWGSGSGRRYVGVR